MFMGLECDVQQVLIDVMVRCPHTFDHLAYQGFYDYSISIAKQEFSDAIHFFFLRTHDHSGHKKKNLAEQSYKFADIFYNGTGKRCSVYHSTRLYPANTIPLPSSERSPRDLIGTFGKP